MDERWIWVAVAIGGGIAAGAVAGLFLRRLLDRPDRRPGVRETAAPLSVFVFWLLTGAGIVFAIAVSSPETLKPIPRDILDWLPNVALAGLLLIAGYGLGLTLSVAVGRALARAAGHRQRSLERGVRTTVIVGAGILALSQLGVDTTVLNIVIAAFLFGIALALAGIAMLGGRSVASHMAAGRALSTILETGATIQVGDRRGTVVQTETAHVLLELETGGRVLVPYGKILDDDIHLLDEPQPGSG